MKAFTDIDTTTDYNRMGLDLNLAPDHARLTFNQQVKRLARRIWAHLTWGRWTAIGLFVAAFVTAQWLKRHW
jgi:hypothetical protein